MSLEVFNNSFEPCLLFILILGTHCLDIFLSIILAFLLVYFVSPFPYNLFCFTLILGLTYKRECKLFCCDMLASLLLPHVLGLSQPAALVAMSQCILLLLFCPSAPCASSGGTQSPLWTNSLSRLLSASHLLGLWPSPVAIEDPWPPPEAKDNRSEFPKFKIPISQGISFIAFICFSPSILWYYLSLLQKIYLEYK